MELLGSPHSPSVTFVLVDGMLKTEIPDTVNEDVGLYAVDEPKDKVKDRFVWNGCEIIKEAYYDEKLVGRSPINNRLSTAVGLQTNERNNTSNSKDKLTGELAKPTSKDKLKGELALCDTEKQVLRELKSRKKIFESLEQFSNPQQRNTSGTK